MRGEGSVFYDEARGRWVAQLYVGGRPVRRMRGNKRDAGRALAQLRRERDAGRDPSRVTLSAYLTDWIAYKETDGTRVNTLRGYRSRVAALQRGLGSITLAELSPRDVEHYTASLGLSARTAAHHRAVLANALQDAMRWRLVEVNVAALARPPRIERAERVVLTPDEVRAMLDALDGDPWRPVYMLAATLGLRQGEVLGLRWADVDLDAGELRIRQTVRRVNGQDIFERPKTVRSARALPLTPALVDALRAAQDGAHGPGAARRECDSGLVFQTDEGEALRPQTVLRHLHRVLAAAGLPRVTFHDLRHSAASALAVQGVPPKVAAVILGHANVSTTLDVYTHVLDAQVREAFGLEPKPRTEPHTGPGE